MPRRAARSLSVAEDLHPVSRAYLKDMPVLQSRFAAQGGVFSVTDFMPVVEHAFAGEHVGIAQICRRFLCESGVVAVELHIQPSFAFHGTKDAVRPRIQNDVARFDDDGRELCIQSEGSNLQFDGKLKIIRTIAAGERFDVLITLSEPAGLTRFGLHDIDYLESSTIRYWRDWTSKIQYNGPYSEQVVRSAITLKLLQFSATGAIVAAPIFRRWISPSRMPNEPAPSGGAAQH